MIPVGNLWLTEAVDREFRVDRVTFVHRDKLPRVRKRLGLGAPVSEIKKTIRDWDFFESAKAFAVVRHTGTPEEVEDHCLEIVREELSILTASQLGYSNRAQMRPIVPAGEVSEPLIRYLAVSSRDRTRFGQLLKRTAPLGEVILDRRWKSYQGEMFFMNLLKILRGKTEVEGSWRKELRRASVMLGESVGANDLLKSFVWNMVVLELLLTEQGERTRDALPSRAEALLGWVSFWEPESYEERLSDVYSKRNALLHSGKRENISYRDVAFTDHLLVNLLLNLANNPRLFGSKSDVVQLSKKVEAERTLGLKSSVRPRNLRFTRRVRPDF